MENQNDAVFITDKGAAVLAAIDAGLIPETEGGYDIGAFEKFWELYSEKSLRTMEQQLEYANKNARKLIEMLNAERDQRADDRADYRVASRRDFFAMIFGFWFGGILTFLIHCR